MIIRQKRLEKGWSQTQLAEFTGLSLRTIQRVEKGKKPTMESLKALASVFETDISSLTQNQEIDESSLTEEELKELKKIRRMRIFFFELYAYLLVVPLVCLANWLFDPNQIWGGLLALGWGTWLAFEAYDVLEASDLFGEGWEKRQLDKRSRNKD